MSSSKQPKETSSKPTEDEDKTDIWDTYWGDATDDQKLQMIDCVRGPYSDGNTVEYHWENQKESLHGYQQMLLKDGPKAINDVRWKVADMISDNIHASMRDHELFKLMAGSLLLAMYCDKFRDNEAGDETRSFLWDVNTLSLKDFDFNEFNSSKEKN